MITSPDSTSTPTEPAYFSTWGPLDGPVRWQIHPPDLGVHTGTDQIWAVGTAHRAGYLTRHSNPVALFRLVVKNVRLHGLYVCERRRFVRLEDVTE